MNNQKIGKNAILIEYKKQSFKRYKKAVGCIKRLEEKLAAMEEKIKSIKSTNYSGMPRGGEPVSLAELLSDKIELENRIDRLAAKNKKLKDSIASEIDTLDDPRYCRILEAYFIDCRTIEDIAAREGYSPRHVYRLYTEAITLLSIKCQ